MRSIKFILLRVSQSTYCMPKGGKMVSSGFHFPLRGTIFWKKICKFFPTAQKRRWKKSGVSLNDLQSDSNSNFKQFVRLFLNIQGFASQMSHPVYFISHKCFEKFLEKRRMILLEPHFLICIWGLDKQPP